MRGKIVIAGGTGALGTLLSNAYTEQGREVVVLGRSGADVSGKAKHVHWNGHTISDWAGELEGATAVVNLAGRSIDTRFTAKHKREIVESRVMSTAVIGEAISHCRHPPAVWVNAGGISIYTPSAAIRTEHDLPEGTDFLAQVSQQWETAFANAATPMTRKVQLRIGAVLLSEGGMLGPLVKLTKLGLGGTVGHGDQYVSWIHGDDFVKLVDWLIQNGHISGVVHASSPNPVTNADFMQALRKRVGAPVGIPTPAWAVRLGAWFIGTEPQLALDGRRVVSHVLEEAGFQFDFPEIQDALHHLML
ncbi:MAG TPA: TIGR01777 family oxidoreductase [Parapedobacter sp.]|nr:TIGR01777 family oxidoreductase [Parapedobacter sp.]